MLRVLMGHATARAGCAGFSLYQDATNEEALTICDRWVTREDLDEHIRSAEYRLLLAVIDLSVITSGHQLRRVSSTSVASTSCTRCEPRSKRFERRRRHDRSGASHADEHWRMGPSSPTGLG